MSPIVKKIVAKHKFIPPYEELREIVEREHWTTLTQRELDDATDTVADELADYLENPPGSY